MINSRSSIFNPVNERIISLFLYVKHAESSSLLSHINRRAISFNSKHFVNLNRKISSFGCTISASKCSNHISFSSYTYSCTSSL